MSISNAKFTLDDYKLVHQAGFISEPLSADFRTTRPRTMSQIVIDARPGMIPK
jgi:hypothetical protein